MTVDPNKELAEVLRELRRASKRSQLQFGNDVDIDRTHVSNIERMESSPTAEVLFRMAEELNVPLWVIMKEVYDRMDKKK